MEHLKDSPVTAQHIRLWTQTDPILSGVLHFISHGWPDVIDPKFMSYSSKRQELSSQDGCVLWGSWAAFLLKEERGYFKSYTRGIQECPG